MCPIPKSRRISDRCKVHPTRHASTIWLSVPQSPNWRRGKPSCLCNRGSIWCAEATTAIDFPTSANNFDLEIGLEPSDVTHDIKQVDMMRKSFHPRIWKLRCLRWCRGTWCESIKGWKVFLRHRVSRLMISNIRASKVTPFGKLVRSRHIIIAVLTMICLSWKVLRESQNRLEDGLSVLSHQNVCPSLHDHQYKTE